MRQILAWLGVPLNMVVVAFTLAPIGFLWIFLTTYQANLPRGDDVPRGLPVAVAVQEGALTIEPLFRADLGHITVFNKLVTATVAALTDWNLIVEMYVIFVLGIVVFALVAYLLYRTLPKEAASASMILASILFFSVHQNTNWFIGAHNVWLFVELFYLLGVLTLLLPRSRGWVPVVLLPLWGVLATFTHGNGVVVWVGLLPLMWWRGYRLRQWYIYLIWVTVAVAMVSVYLTIASVTVSAEAGVSETQGVSLSLDTLSQSIQFTLGIIGSVFVSNASIPAIRVGLAALILFAANLVYLAWRERKWDVVSIWLTVALHSLGTATLIGLTRFGTYPTGIDESLASRYTTPTMFFWLALIALGAAVIGYAQRQRTWINYPLAVVNIAFGAFLMAIFAPGVHIKLQRPYYDEQRFINESCALWWFYVQDTTRLPDQGCVVFNMKHVNELALYRLALFAQREPQMILPEQYTVGTPVIVEGDQAWVSYNIDTWLLSGVDRNDLVHISPEQPVSDFKGEIVLDQWAADGDMLREYTADVDSLWYVRRSDMPSAFTDYWNVLVDDDFVPTSFTYTTDAGVDITITRYQKLDLQTDSPTQFGDHIRMIGWTSLSDRLAACSTVTVRSFWETDAPLLDGFSATLTLDRITGDGVWDYETVARTDSQLTLTPSNAWVEGERYLDERTLDIPCDLEAGDYALQIGIYNYRDGVRLIPTVEDESFPPELDIRRMETITVSP